MEEMKRADRLNKIWQDNEIKKSQKLTREIPIVREHNYIYNRAFKQGQEQERKRIIEIITKANNTYGCSYQIRFIEALKQQIEDTSKEKDLKSGKFALKLVEQGQEQKKIKDMLIIVKWCKKHLIPIEDYKELKAQIQGGKT